MGYRFMLVWALMLPLGAFCQSFNGNFETLQPNGIPTGWSIEDASGAATSTDAHLGKKAAKAWIYKNYEPGIWIAASDPINGNASEVSGYYKYLGEKKECDKASVSYLLGAKTAEGGIDTIAFGSTELKLNKEYSKFSLSVSATGAGTPEFMNIFMKPSGHCDIHGTSNCCFLFVDDLVLAGSSQPLAPKVEEVENVEETPVIVTEDPTENAEESGEVTPDSLGGNIESPDTLTTETQPLEENATPEGTEGSKTKEGEVGKEIAPTEESDEVPMEEESTEPVDEGWKSEEESATDDDNR